MNRITQILILLLFAGLSHAQTFRFNQYTTEDGISQNFIYSINQDKNGYLWVGTGEGLCKFDGKHFETYTTEDGLAEDVITCSYSDESGTQWFGHNEGGITIFKPGGFQQLSRTKLIDSKINAISGFGEKVFGIAQNQGLFEIQGNKLDIIGTFGADAFYSMQCIDEDNMLLGTDAGLLHLKQDGEMWKLQKKYKSESWISSIAPSSEDGVYLMAMQNEGIAKVRLKNGIIEFSDWDSDFDMSELQIQTIIEDNSSNIWLGTFGAGLIKLHTDSSLHPEVEVTRYNTETGMSSDFVQSVFQDREGNIWVGTFGAGLSTLIDDFFTFYAHDPERYGNNVSSIWISGNQKWYGVENGLIQISSELDSNWTFYDSKNGFVDDKVTALHFSDSTLWIGTSDHGMYAYSFETKSIRKINWDYGNLQQKINQISGKEGSVWIGTEGGLIVYYIENGETNLFDTEVGLAHNSIKTVCSGDDGTIWMGTHSRFVYGIKDFTIDEYEITNGGELEVVDITEDSNGQLWIATAENGVFQKTKKKFKHYSTAEGLKSNYTYAVKEDPNGSIWVGHRGGLSRIMPDREQIIFYDHKSGITDQVNPGAMFLDEKDYLWIGTDGGAIQYDPSKDKQLNVPPVTNLLSVTIDDKTYPVDEPITLPYDNYRVQFNFIGISFENPEKVTYKYKLEGHDKVFSDFTYESSATYGRVVDGEYEFKVIACNGEDNCTEEAASIKITVKKPFWKQIWFFVVEFLALVGIVLLIVRARVKRFQANQRYLEEQLAIKTKEVVEKAEIIQEINKDLTASINYAERIQHSILPKLESFESKFPNSFFFFRPRDIVSGDFYFLREYPDKTIIGCVDCTGHGVPGAFMSMIGSTTLRNIYKLMDSSGKWLTPDQVLDMLDEEVQKILHQRLSGNEEEDFFKSRDGMDMTLVEIHHKDKKVLLSSAKRHSFIMRKDEIELLSGDKRPIGGGEIDQVDFNLQEYTMNEGDVLFLFSDGYPDQFGGAESRKLKLSGVKQIIESMRDKDPSAYGEIIETNFYKWMDDKEQVDDVLMIGIVF